MKIVTFGEIMMRLNPEGYLRFVQAEKFEASYAGGEANVAVSLANYGIDASFVTKLPANPLGEAARNALRHFGVDTSDIVWGGPRLGLYFVEKGAAQRPSKVVYDRAGSSIALAKRGDFEWSKILKKAKWFHFTGITPALGGELPAICLDALKYCKAHKITVSCDLNYRGKLWTKTEAGKCMAKLVPFVDVLIANEADAADVFGITAKGTDVDSGKLDKPGYVSVAEQLVKRFGVRKVAITLRTSIQSLGWNALRCEVEKRFLLAGVRHQHCGSRWRRRLLRRRTHLRARDGRNAAVCDRLRGCGELSQTFDRTRLQSRHRRGSRVACGGQRVRKGAKVKSVKCKV